MSKDFEEHHGSAGARRMGGLGGHFVAPHSG